MAAARLTRRRLALGVVAALLVGLVLLWIEREPVLARLGGLVVEEQDLGPADLAVLLSSNPVLAAVEGARYFKEGYVPRILLFASRPDIEAEIAERLGVAVPKPHEVAVLVMRRMGVPTEAIVVKPRGLDGTNAAVRAAARYARQHNARRLIVVAHRSHTRRTAKLLKGYLGEPSVVIMRASPHDPYQPERWWRQRESARELLLEGLRWMNSILFGDFWRRDDTEDSADGSGICWGRPAVADGSRALRPEG